MLRAAADLARENWEAAEVEYELQQRVNAGALKGPVPSRPTLRDIVKEYRPPDPSGPWSVVEATGDDAMIVLAVLKDAVIFTQGHVRRFSRREAAAIVTVTRAAPDLSTWLRWFLAREYVRRGLNDESTEDLDLFVAFGRWRSEKDDRNYQALKAEGWLPNTDILNTDLAQESRRILEELQALQERWANEHQAMKSNLERWRDLEKAPKRKARKQ